jgi:hypothetical protein
MLRRSASRAWVSAPPSSPCLELSSPLALGCQRRASLSPRASAPRGRRWNSLLRKQGMKRAGGLFERIASFENLHLAYRKARRGKRNRRSVDGFSFALERELRPAGGAPRGLLPPRAAPELRHRGLTGRIVATPKRRRIEAAPCRDRVLHHALLSVLEPVTVELPGPPRPSPPHRAALWQRSGRCVPLPDVLEFSPRLAVGTVDSPCALRVGPQEGRREPAEARRSF